MKVLYFGCIGETGHYLHDTERSRIRGGYKPEIGYLAGIIDGNFCPPCQTQNGKWLRTEEGPWTIISWWDNSVDTRPGSHSSFLFQGFKTTEAMFAAAKEKFPSVFARQLEPLEPFQK